MKLLEKVSEKPLEIIVAICAIFIGSLLPIIIDEWKQQTPIIKVILFVAAAFGGALLSNSLVNNAKLISEEADKQRKNYHDRISPINRHLDSLTKELSNIIRGVEGKELAASEGIFLINQLIPNLVTAMTDTGDVLGEKFDPSIIFETAQKIEELNRLLASIDKERDRNKKKELLKEAQTTLTHLTQIHPDVYKKVSEDVKCPACGITTQTSIGKHSPASSMAVCHGCGLLFHCHRDAIGNVFTSLPGKNKKSIQPSDKMLIQHTIKCSCGEKFNAKFVAGDPQK